MASKNIIITAGDPLGIGPQVLVKALKKLPAAALKRITVIGEEQSLNTFGFTALNVKFIPIKSKFKRPLKPAPSKYGGDVSYKALKLAVDMLLAHGGALVTAPISKEAWAKCAINFTGHTEMLNHYAAQTGALMCFTAGKVNCALVSEHYAIKDLPKVITQARVIQTVKNFADVLGKAAPIAVASLNPHAGDGGKIGSEEKVIIIPAINKLKKAGYNITGPLPIDSLWFKHSKGAFSGIVCMYHDQALTGLKLAAKQPIVHMTAGLKFLRTSPTHGTAFDIAAKNMADYKSMLAAIKKVL